MPPSKNTLEAKSGALHGQCSDEVIKVNRAILAIDPAHIAACNRLGVAHIDRGQADEARAVFEAGLAANPHNPIAARRLEALRRPPIVPRSPRRTTKPRPV